MAKRSTRKPAEAEVTPAATALSPAEERNWAMLAHLSVLLNLFTGFLGPVAALTIYLVYQPRSRYVAYQSLQALVFQLVWWVGAGAIVAGIWVVTGALSAVIVGLLCVPFACVLTLLPGVALVYGTYAAVECSQGRDFRYWLIGDWVRGTLEH